MPWKGWVRERKAAGTVVTVILMIGVVATVGIIIVQAGLSMLVESQVSIGTFTDVSKVKIRERFVVDDVWFNSSTNAIVSVGNVGGVPVTIIAISFNGTDISPFEEVTIGIDQWVSIAVDSPFPEGWTEGGVYVVEVFSELGNVHRSTWKV